MSIKMSLLDWNRPLCRVFWASVFSVGVAAGTYGLILRHPIWDANDDVFMSMIAAGVWLAPHPSADLVFVHPFLGYPLRCLHLWYPDCPWYAISLCCCLALSLGLLCFSVLRLRPTRNFSLIVCYAALATALPSLAYLQWTTIAGLTATSGVVALLSLLIHRPSVSLAKYWVAVLLSLLMLSLGAMIRYHSALMILVVAFPCGCMLLMDAQDQGAPGEQSSRVSWRSFAAIAVAAFLCMNGVAAVRHYWYREDARWSRFSVLVRVRSLIRDFGGLQYAPKTFEPVGWTQTDYAMIQRWLDIDPLQYSPSRMNTVLENSPRMSALRRVLEFGRWPMGVRRMLGQTRRFPSHCMLSLCTCLAVTLLAFVSRRRWALMAIVTVGGTCTLLLLYLHVGLGHGPYRVHATLWMAALWLVLLVAAASRHGTLPADPLRLRIAFRSKAMSGLLVLLALAMIIDFVRGYRKAVVATDNHQQLERRIQKWETALPQGSIICAAGPAFPYEHHLPISSFSTMRSLKGFVGLDWFNQTPQQQQVMEQFGLGEDFWGSLARTENVFWVEGAFSEGSARVLRDYYREKYDMELLFSEVSGFPFLKRMGISRIDPTP
jgi:hypothetical protein